MKPDTIREATLALAREGELMDDLIVSLADADWDRPVHDSGWTVRDVVGHVGASHVGIRGILRGEWSGGVPATPLTNINEERRQERADWPLARLLGELGDSRRAMIEFLGSVGEDAAERPFRGRSGVERPLWRWAWLTPTHERDHRREVARALGRPVAPAYVASLNVSRGGLPKLPVFRQELSEVGLRDDAHKSPRHGGPSAALCLFGLDVIEQLQKEGHPIIPGAVGENLTIAGVPWKSLQPGDRLRVGPTLIELTRFTTPCTNVAGAFKDGSFERILHQTNPGDARIYASVLEPGTITVGDPVEVLGPAT